MRAVVQRVRKASVSVADEVVGAIGDGLVVFVGAASGDEESDLSYLVNKVANLRVFPDDSGRMSKSVIDTGGGVLVVSQFTVFGDVRRGLRPSFDAAMEPVLAEQRYNQFVAEMQKRVSRVATGRFRADMVVTVENDGPVTILIDSKRLF